MMESIEKLREWARGVTNSNPDENIVSPEFVAQECGRKVLLIADAIEREIAEHYMELPVDADGEPIRVDNVVEFGENRNQGIVKALNEHMVIAMHVDDDYMNYAKYGLLWNADACRHVKERTLEDVLTDFAEAIEERGTEWVDVSQTANAIRKLLRGDAE